MKKQCDCCGRMISPHESNTDAQHTICKACYQRSYTRCSICGTMIHREDAYHDRETVCCYRCYNDRFCYIHPHDYKPLPIFYGGIPRHFGVELEIDGGGHNDENAKKLLDAVNTDAEYIYIKTDSSLHDGLEIVTHPMTLDFHLQHFAWEKLLRAAARLGYHADDAETCGLHIHVNRHSLGNTPEQQEAAINRILDLIEANRDTLCRISRRKAAYWTNPDHAMINLQHTETVEFRLFQSTLQAALLFQSLQTAEQICDNQISQIE